MALGFDADEVVETDLMERPIAAPTQVNNNRFSFRIGKHEIKTFKLSTGEKS
jgi:hypothetical protein